MPTNRYANIIGENRHSNLHMGRQYVIVYKEVYSGDSNDDPTILESDTWARWSVRSRGWNNPLNLQPMAVRHVAFSIEELSMIEFDDVETREED